MIGAAAEVQPLPRRKRADLIAEEITRWIVTRSLAPGARLPRERELIELFRASRASVREALTILESQGLVETHPGAGGGPRTASIGLDKASRQLRNYFYFQDLSWKQVYALRRRVEPALAEVVARGLGEAELEALEQTQAVCECGQVGRASEREVRFAELRFHAVLADACDDPLLRFLCRFVIDILADFVTYRSIISSEDTEFAQHNVDAHRALIDALRARDARRARFLMDAHLRTLDHFIADREDKVELGLGLSAQSGRR